MSPSLRNPYGNTRSILLLRQFSLQRHLPYIHFRRQCMEWRRFLYRSLWSQVCHLRERMPSFSYSDCRFERELEALRKELAETTARSESFRTSPTNSNSSLPTDSTPSSPREILAMDQTIPPLELDTGSPTIPETKMTTESAIPPLELNSGSPEAPESKKLHDE